MDIVGFIPFILAFGVILIMVVIVGMLLGGFCALLMNIYFTRKVSHDRLGVRIVKLMSELVVEMREEGEFSDKQKAFFDNLLDLSASRSFVRFYFRKALLGSVARGLKTSERTLDDLELLSGFSRDSKVFNSVIALTLLSILGGSTCNFFLGGLFRSFYFSDVLDILRDPHIVKNAAKRKVFIDKPAFSIFEENFSLAA